MDETAAKGFPENLPPQWRQHLSPEAEKDYFRALKNFLLREYKSQKKIFPPRGMVLRALQSLDLDDVKVVILGQDPYHGPGQAVGLSFAVPNELLPKPPSLMNIFKEIESELKVEMPERASDLSGWAAQGVLLLNAVLTVQASQAFSHRGKGWENFTNRIIEVINEREAPVIFVLWGSAAQKKKELITHTRHFILESAHPSPLSAYRGFFGCGHFAKINEILAKKLKREPIDWTKTTLNG